MRFFIQTLGCKINQYESQAVREAWEAAGWTEAPLPGEADAILVHTCAVTAGAVADSRGAVRRAGRAAPQARIVVAGCAAQTEPATFSGLPGVDAVLPQAAKPGLCGWPLRSAPVADHSRTQDAPDALWPAFSISGFQRARPILKVQDGCSQCCTYCIVPRARGPARSRPFADIAAEAVRLLQAGHRELVISGINLGQFRLDSAQSDPGGFWTMLARLEHTLFPEWGGISRLRLSSLDPGMLTGKALAFLASSRMVCPHLHISMQSASPGILPAMGRSHYGPDQVLRFLDALRQPWPLLALGADILTGFPGESREDFQATRDFLREARLTYAHIFPYSRRPGTIAATAPGQVPHAEKKRRAAALRRDAALLKEDFLGQLLRVPGLTMAVESSSPCTGLSEYYVECRADGPSPVESGRLLAVRPCGLEGGRLLAKAAPVDDGGPPP